MRGFSTEEEVELFYKKGIDRQAWDLGRWTTWKYGRTWRSFRGGLLTYLTYHRHLSGATSHGVSISKVSGANEPTLRVWWGENGGEGSGHHSNNYSSTHVSICSLV